MHGYTFVHFIRVSVRVYGLAYICVSVCVLLLSVILSERVSMHACMHLKMSEHTPTNTKKTQNCISTHADLNLIKVNARGRIDHGFGRSHFNHFFFALREHQVVLSYGFILFLQHPAQVHDGLCTKEFVHARVHTHTHTHASTHASTRTNSVAVWKCVRVNKHA